MDLDYLEKKIKTEKKKIYESIDVIKNTIVSELNKKIKKLNQKEKEIKKQKSALIKNLRTSFKRNVDIESSKNNLSEKSLTDVSIINIHKDLYQNAHIISFSILFDEGFEENDTTKLHDAISGSNCLRLSPNDHMKFDRNIMTIDSRGNVYEYNFKNKKTIKSTRFVFVRDLKDKNRKQFLERNYKYFQKHGKNINKNKHFP